MANCNCNDFPISCAPHAPGGDCCHPHGCPPHPCPPPPFKGGTSMYIGARYVPIFADPVEWDDEREYEPLTIVVHNGDCYTSKCYVPKGAQLPPYPEGQTKYWVKTSDYNYQFADLKKTVTDLSRLVEQFQKDNERFTELINGWNEKVIQWEKDMAAWGERLDAVESNVADLTASLNAEIARAKAAEQANAAAIAQETADRKQAVSELDAAYKAADAAEAQARAEADTALSNRIATNTTDIDAIKAEQVIQNTNISANAKNISDNAAEIAKHAARLTDLESNASDWDDVFPDTTIAQEVQKEENARANAVTELKAKDTQLAADIEEVRDLANHKVDQTTFQAADIMNVKYGNAAHSVILSSSLLTAPVSDITRENVNKAYAITNNPALQNANNYFRFPMSTLALKSEVDGAQATADKANANIGDWENDHPGQTISQCVTSVENEIAAVDAKADANAANIGDWRTSFPNQTIAQAVTDCMPYDKSGVIIPVAKNIPSVVNESVVLAWLNRPLRLSPADETKTLSIAIGVLHPITKEFHVVGPQTLRINEFAATAETPVSTSFASTASIELASNYCIRLNPNVADTGVVGLRYTTASTASGSPYYLGFDAVQIAWS
nr:MAG TPA: Nuclear pore complex protein [Caudoviricetes sp.]